MSTTENITAPAPVVAAPPLRWPPPALESLHGAVWSAVTPLAAAAVVLTAPMLVALASEQPFWSNGVLSSSWWLLIAVAALGTALLIGGLERLVRAIRLAAKAVTRGHDWRTVAIIATDAAHDAGFLLQGMRQYARVEQHERRLLSAARVVAALAYVAALLWATVGFGLGILLAGRGIITTGRGLSLFVLIPTALLLMPAVAARVIESVSTRKLHRDFRRDASAEHALRDEVIAWNAAAGERFGFTRRSSSPRIARIAAAVLILLAIFLPLPIFTVAAAGSVGSLIAEIAVPKYGLTALKHTRAQLMQPFVLPPDGSITPIEAGRLMHIIGTAASYAPGPLEVSPVRRHPDWPTTTAAPGGPREIMMFNNDAFERLGSLTPDEIAFLEETSAHPLHAEFARLARAPQADLMGARLNLASIVTVDPWQIPIPRFGRIRETAHYHVGKAVLEASRGQTAQAEVTLREVVSVGVMMSREGATLIESLIGAVITDIGAKGLENFYAATGRTAEAAQLRSLAATFEAVEKTIKPISANGSAELESLMRVASDSSAMRGLRWEALMLMQYVSPCLNPHSTVFGRGHEYTQWLEKMRSQLVRYPSDEAMFASMMQGPSHLEGGALLKGLLGVTLASEHSRACADVASAMSQMM